MTPSNGWAEFHRKFSEVQHVDDLLVPTHDSPLAFNPTSPLLHHLVALSPSSPL